MVGIKEPFRNKKALSQTVTTMILLVIPIILTGGVAMYSYQIIDSNLQTEVIIVSKQYIWIYGNDSSFAALEIDNVGGRDALIDKIEVRGVEVLWPTIHYFKTLLIVTDLPNSPISNGNNWTNFEYTPGTVENFTQASSDIPLPSGYTIVLYIENPDNIIIKDVGTYVSITVYTKQTQYQILCSAQSAENP